MHPSKDNPDVMLDDDEDISGMPPEAQIMCLIVKETMPFGIHKENLIGLSMEIMEAWGSAEAALQFLKDNQGKRAFLQGTKI